MNKNYEYLSIRYEADKSGISVHKRTLPNDYPLHFHDFYEMEYILSGSGVTYVNNIPYNIETGSLIFITPMDFQSIKVKSPMMIININFNADWIDNSIIHFCESATVLQNIDKDEIERMYAEFSNKNPHYSLLIRGILNGLLINVIRQTIPFSNNQNTDITHKIAHYIRLHHSEYISLKIIAKKFGYSPNYLSSVFSKSYDKTIKQYIIDTRLEHSLKMLISTNASVTTICFDSGFKSFSNFLRTFKSTYNMTPKEYRSKFKS